MQNSDVFTFCQNDLQSNSFAALQGMRKKGQFCDVIIKVQNKSITAHRNIVAAGIPYFRTAFDFTDSESKEKEIAVQDLDPKALESLILFAYTSKVDITAENVRPLFVAAQFLGLDQVCDSCTKFMSKKLNIDSVWQVHKWANGLNNSVLVANCNGYIVKNFEDFSRTCDFLDLPATLLKEILAANNLFVSSEEVVFESIMKWVKFSPSSREISLSELLAEVRMVYLPVPYLVKNVDTEELVMNSKPCRDLINEVKCYHLLPDMRAELVKLKTRPRNRFMRYLYAICLSLNSDSDLDSDSDNTDLCVFSLVDNKWIALASTDLLGAVCNIVGVNGKIYIFSHNTALIFNPENNEWEHLEISEIPEGAVTVCDEGKIYCFYIGNDFQTEMQFFDTLTNKWSETKKQTETVPRGSAAASQEGYIYITGGFAERTSVRTVKKYCSSDDEWTDVEPMLVGRYKHFCTSMNGKIYVCGGKNFIGHYPTTLDAAEVYDPTINRWSYISLMQRDMTIVSLTEHYGRMYAFGCEEIEVYEPETDEWKSCSYELTGIYQGAVSISSSIHSGTR